VRVDHQRGATPAARLPEADRVHPALGGDSDNVGAEPIDLCLDVAEVRPNWKVRLLRVRDVQDPVHLEACLLDHQALPRIHLASKARTDDQDPPPAPMRFRPRGRLHSSNLSEVVLEVRVVDAPLATRDGHERGIHRVEVPVVAHDLAAVRTGQDELIDPGVVLHRGQELQL